jgi:hypothetical protein
MARIGHRVSIVSTKYVMRLPSFASIAKAVITAHAKYRPISLSWQRRMASIPTRSNGRLEGKTKIVELGMEFYEAQQRHKRIHYLKAKATELGFKIVAAPAA